MSLITQFLHRYLPRALLSLVLCQISLVLAGCSPPPIPIKIGNVTLSSKNTARGLNISVGSPQQSFAILPQWPLNNSFLYGTNGYCSSSWSTSACTTWRGGQYDQIASTTRQAASSDLFAAEGGTYPSLNYMTDNLTLSSNVTLRSFPLGIALSDWGSQGYYPQMALGLGLNSSILNTLYTTGKIASRSWSMFWGRTGGTKDTQLDGNFLLGGYDRAKTTGQNYTRSLTHGNNSCTTKMLVTITDISINFPNGTDASLFGASQSAAMTACIVPDYPILMTLPADPYFYNFETLTKSTITDRTFGLYYYGLTYDDNVTPFKGDLSITLDSGLVVRVPNDQLVVPNLSLDEKAGNWVANSSKPELIINPITNVNADDLPQLGRQFLTAAYVMLNQDTDEFTLWNANPTSAEDFVAVDSKNNVVEQADFCSNKAKASSTGTGAAGSQNTSPAAIKTDSSSKKLSGGAIAGIAIGSVAFLAALTALVFFVLARKRKNANAAAKELPADSAVQQVLHDPSYGYFEPQKPQELSAKQGVMSPTPTYSPPVQLDATEAMVRQELPG